MSSDDDELWRTPAFEDLCVNLEYARNLVTGGRSLEHLQVRSFDVADLYRAAWVQAVSAFDHWVHRELYDRALGIALNVDIERPARFSALKVPMSVFEDVHHHSKALREAFADQLRAQFGHLSFQAPDKVKEALSHVSDVSKLWENVATRLPDESGQKVTRDQVVDALKEIVQRRNRIAHEADRDPDRPDRRQVITASDATTVIERLRRTARAIAIGLGRTPPIPVTAHTRSRPDVLTPTGQLYQEFWASFLAEARKRDWTKGTVAPRDNWVSLSAGVTGVMWVVSFTRFGCRSELSFQDPDPARNLARWRVLAEQRELIADTFGGDELWFDPLEDRKSCRIEARRYGPTINERHAWPDVLQWMLDSQDSLRVAVEKAGGVPRG